MNDNNTAAEIYILLGEIKGQLSSLLSSFAARNAEDDKKHERHERRLAALEKVVWIAVGVGVASGGLAGTVAGALMK